MSLGGGPIVLLLRVTPLPDIAWSDLFLTGHVVVTALSILPKGLFRKRIFMFYRGADDHSNRRQEKEGKRLIPHGRGNADGRYVPHPVVNHVQVRNPSTVWRGVHDSLFFAGTFFVTF